jgi:hypothetical protein
MNKYPERRNCSSIGISIRPKGNEGSKTSTFSKDKEEEEIIGDECANMTMDFTNFEVLI